jgi:MoxR-like ATPase
MAAPLDTLGFYRGNQPPSRRLAQRDQPVQQAMEAPDTYIPDAALVRAVNVSLLLGMPLLLTGDPGVGKTRLATHLAQMQRAPLERFVVTSTATARDLLYSFDELARMRAVYREEGEPDLRRYLRFNALGSAILRACGPDAPLEEIVTSAPESASVAAGAESRNGVPAAESLSPVWRRLGIRRERNAPMPCVRDVFDFGQDERRAERNGADPRNPTVVLIDEIDKAPRELPNDLLTELDRFEFAIPELGLRVVPPAEAARPVLVITSNRETSLPDPFLRRCCYHHIGFPDPETLQLIVDGHMDRLLGNEASARPEPARTRLRQEARGAAMFLRETQRLLRPPGLAEIIQWQILLETRLLPQIPEGGLTDPALQPEIDGTLGVLLKTPEDLAVGREAMQHYLGRLRPAVA